MQADGVDAVRQGGDIRPAGPDQVVAPARHKTDCRTVLKKPRREGFCRRQDPAAFRRPPQRTAISINCSRLSTNKPKKPSTSPRTNQRPAGAALGAEAIGITVVTLTDGPQIIKKTALTPGGWAGIVKSSRRKRSRGAEITNSEPPAPAPGAIGRWHRDRATARR